VLAHCLAWKQRETLTQLRREMERAIDASARPFEVIVGSPHARFGARVTFRLPEAASDRIAHELGLEPHPWGPASWLGLRISHQGDVEWKSYHRARAVPRDLTPPRAAPAPLVPVMAALHRDKYEVYYRLAERMRWVDFAASAMRLASADPPRTDIPISPAVDAFCLSLSWVGKDLGSLTVFADDRTLPAEPEASQLWRDELPDDDDRVIYDAAVAGVRSLGPRAARGWHAMFAWTCSCDRQVSRAVSLRVRFGSPRESIRSAADL
jgi:hypothetical protein